MTISTLLSHLSQLENWKDGPLCKFIPLVFQGIRLEARLSANSSNNGLNLEKRRKEGVGERIVGNF